MTSLHEYIRPLGTEGIIYVLLDSFDGGSRPVTKVQLRGHMVPRSHPELGMNSQDGVLRGDSRRDLEGYLIYGAIEGLGGD